MKKITVGIMGFGTVGAGVYNILTQNKSDIFHRENLDFTVKKVLIKDFEHEPNLALAPREIFTTSYKDIATDDEISIVIECMGGTEPARTFILAALNSGKTVVTSNKEVIAKHWPEFEQAAKATGAGLYIEATAGGGVPIIRTLLDAMQANNIELLMGIVNGTTNYILTKMADEGLAYEQVLAEAQKLGYAEANPAADVEGFDCVYKLSILSSIAFHARVPIDYIYREGISEISAEDMEVAKELGYVIKLLAIGKKIGGPNGQLQVRVHPAMIPQKHPLANVSGVFNAVFLTGHAVDDIMLYGRGAGQMPTASAVVSDAIYAAHAHSHKYMTFDNTVGAPQTLVLQDDWLSGFAIRLTVADEVGVMAKLSAIFANNAVSIHSMNQRGEDAEKGCVSIIFVTHTAKEKAVRSAVEQIKAQKFVHSVDSVMRVER